MPWQLKPGRDVEARDVAGLAHAEGGVGRERLRRVEEPRVARRRAAPGRAPRPARGRARSAPSRARARRSPAAATRGASGLAVRLERADQQRPVRVPHVEVGVEVAEHRQIGRRAGDRPVRTWTCAAAYSGTVDPAAAARSRVHRPQASTTRSHSTSPCAVTTAVTRPPAARTPVTSTSSRNVTPRACASCGERERGEARVDVAVLRLVEAADEAVGDGEGPTGADTRPGASSSPGCPCGAPEPAG